MVGNGRSLIPLLFICLALIFLLAKEMTAQVDEGISSNRPLFSLPSGYYEQSQRLELHLPTANQAKDAQIVFTIDGTTPTHPSENASSAIYDRPIYLDARQAAVVVVKARLLLANGELGPVASQSYFLHVAESLPLLSLVVDPADFWDAKTGIYANPLEKGLEWERPCHITYIEPDRQTGFDLEAGIRVHGQFSRDYAKKSLRLYFRSEYGPGWLTYPLFDETEQSLDRLVLHAGGQDASQIPTNWTLLRNQLMANLALQTNSLATRSRPVLLFINGEPWGLYYWRERIDPVFLAEEWGVATAVIVDTPARRIENPDDINTGFEQWDALTAFVETQDLTDPANYAYMVSQVDIANFIDYSLLQIYSANYDWPFTNIKQFKPQTQGGRWQWIIWDSDLSLGLKPWSDVTQNTLAQALDPAYTAGTTLETNGRDTILLRGLLQNDAFRTQFLQRADELLNTVLAPEAVIGQIDMLAAAIEPGIGFENGRWDDASPNAEWAANVEQLRDFARRRPDIMRQQLAVLEN